MDLPPRRDRERALAGRRRVHPLARHGGLLEGAPERSSDCPSAQTTCLHYASTAARASPHSSLSSPSSFRSSLLLSIDQGTTGTTCLVVDEELRPQGRGYREVAQHFPRSGWVEHDPEELWESVLASAADALADAGIAASELQGIGLANQRETTIVWDRRSGRPVHRAIVWQDRRTAERCKELPRELIRDRTGLVPDPYFSATKLEWLLSERDASGLAFGTVDSWLLC